MKRDFSIGGTIPLDWVRYYATDCPVNSWLGRGWTVPFFMRLERRDDGILLTDEVGRPLLFPAPEGRLQEGESVIALGANMELRRESDHFQIIHWHIASDDVERFCFKIRDEDPMPLAWIENLAGHRIILHYDTALRPVRITQGLERRVFELSYNDEDLITEVHFAGEKGQRSLMVRYSYDSLRRLVSSWDAVGSECTYAYDDQHRLTAEGNPLGSVFRFQYDNVGRCIYASGTDRYMERKMQYLTAPRMTRVTDSLGNQTDFYLNPFGQVIQEISPLGATTTTDFDEYGRIMKLVQPDGGVLAYEYDERGNRKILIDESGGRSALVHNELHLLTEFVDPMGSKWTLEYDGRGNLISSTNPLGHRFECVRDERNFVIETRRPGGLITKRRYGERLRSLELIDQVSMIARVEVDDLGRKTAVFDAKGLVHRIRNDALGRPVEIVDGLGRVTRLRYNRNNDLVERVLPGNVWERWEYDPFGRLTTHENGLGRMHLDYDTEDHLTAVVNRAGERLTRRYDPDGRRIAETFFDGRTERYEYTRQGFCTRQVKSDGRAIDFKFDESGCMLSRTSSDGLSEEFGYDKNAKLISARSGEAAVELERDPLGRVVAEIQNGRRVESGFDPDNNRVSRHVVGIEHAEIQLRYDVRGRLTALEDMAGQFQELQWDAGDQLIERRFTGGAVERFAYDGARRVLEQKFSSAVAGRVFDRRYEYDERDNVVQREEIGRRRDEFHYDQISRLTGVNRTGRRVEFYKYDPVGTVLQSHYGSRTVDDGGRNLTDGRRSYEYGPDGCVAAIEAQEGRYELNHDVDGKLVTVTLPDGREARYSYDPLGRRIAKQVGDERVEFVWQSCDLVAELRDSGEPSTYFHYHQAPFAQWTGGVRQIPVVDQMGLPQALLDDQGGPIWQPTYEAYGLLAAEKGAISCPFRFRGQYHDRETGFYYNFHRHYDPKLAGYLAPDPIRLVGGANFYLYPRNPLLWDDPFGLTCSNQHKGQMGEAEMDAHFAGQGYSKIGGGVGPNGIDGVYHNPNGNPPYIIGEAKYGSSTLGSALSGRQMSDNWIDSPIGQANPSSTDPSRLQTAVGPANAAAIQNSATTNPGSVQKQVFNLPPPGTPGTGSVNPGMTKDYTPGSGSRTY